MYHVDIKARDLAKGCGMRIGSSRGYVLVADAQPTDRGIAVTIYDQRDGVDVPNEKPTILLNPDETVSLSPYGRCPVTGPTVPAHELRNRPEDFIGKRISFTSKGWPHRAGRPYEGIVRMVDAVVTSDLTCTSVWIQGVKGAIWIDDLAEVRIG